MSIDQDELFQIKSKFLREVPHPKLILKAIIQTQQNEHFVDEFNSLKTSIGNMELISVLKNYVEELTGVKLQISNSLTAKELHAALIQLYKVHGSLLITLSSYLLASEEYTNDTIKMSVPIDAYSIIKFLEASGIKENQIKTYICNTLSNKLLEDFDVLTIACIRSRKICENAGSI